MSESQLQEQNEVTCCKECGEVLKAPKKCYHCGAYQKFNWMEFFKSLSSATAFILVIISSVSLLQTCQEKRNAEDAFKAAEQALKATKKAKIAAETAREDAIREAKLLVQHLESETKVVLENLSEETASSSEAVKELTNRVKEETLTLDIVSQKAKVVSEQLQALDKTIEFQEILSAARNDDRKAYDKLKKLSEDNSYPFQKKAELQYRLIQRDASYIYKKNEVNRVPTESFERLMHINKKESLKTIAYRYSRIHPTQPYAKPDYIIYIAKRRVDFPLKERLSFLIDIISSDDSLMAAKIANYIFWKLAGEKLDGDGWFDAELTLKYWEENKSKY